MSDNFDEFICRYIIKGTLTNLTQLHVGTGRSDTEFSSIDNALIRIRMKGNEIPYIPGSSLKGIFRTEIERYFKGLGHEICYPYNHQSSCNKKLENICLACQIFGSQQLGSHFLISDSILLQDSGTKIKKGIAINRITGSTQRSALYQIETLQPRSIFSFEFQIININLKDTTDKKGRAIKYLLRLFKNGWLQVGGKRSTGLGQIIINKVEGKLDCMITEILPNESGELEFITMSLEELLGEK